MSGTEMKRPFEKQMLTWHEWRRAFGLPVDAATELKWFRQRGLT